MSTRLVLLVLGIGIIVGCSEHSTSPMTPGSVGSLQLAPADGATAVALDAVVTLSFGVSLNRPAIENGFHLVCEADTARGCPYPNMHHGGMDSVMWNRHGLAHMVAYHATSGGFSWNGAGTACTFRPDSLLQPGTRYMIHMGPGMLETMRRGGCAGAPGQATGWGDRMTHFRTGGTR